MTRFEKICKERGIRGGDRRRAILQVLDQATDHPCADEVHERAALIDPGISLSTIYRTLRILEQAGILNRMELGDGRARYEKADLQHHEHLVDLETGRVLEFRDETIETLLRDAAGRLGYRLVRYKLELFGANSGDRAAAAAED